MLKGETTISKEIEVALAKQKDDEPTLASVATESLKKAHGNVIKATDIMIERVMMDGELYRILMNPLVRTACYNAITMQCRVQRRNIWESAQPSAEESRSKIVALAKGTLNTLMDFPLPGGLRLGDAHRGEVEKAIQDYEGQIGDRVIKKRFLELVLPHVKGKKKVSQSLTPEYLAKLQEQAINE